MSNLQAIARCMGMQHTCFWEKAKGCKLCGQGVPATLEHLINECEATTDICNAFGVPTFSPFVRLWVLHRSGIELGGFCS